MYDPSSSRNPSTMSDLDIAEMYLTCGPDASPSWVLERTSSGEIISLNFNFEQICSLIQEIKPSLRSEDTSSVVQALCDAVTILKAQYKFSNDFDISFMKQHLRCLDSIVNMIIRTEENEVANSLFNELYG